MCVTNVFLKCKDKQHVVGGGGHQAEAVVAFPAKTGDK